MKLSKSALCSSVVLVGLLLGPVHAAGLPNGATSLSESYNAWKVNCAAVKAGETSTVRCSIRQSLINQKTRRPVFTIILSVQADESVKGEVIVPLGISLKDGAQMQIDDGPKTDPYTYATCIRRGCLVQFEWNKKTLTSMQSRKIMNVFAKAMNGKELKFGVQLQGLDKALTRVEQLLDG